MSGDGEPSRNFEFPADESVAVAIVGALAALVLRVDRSFEDAVNVAEEVRTTRPPLSRRRCSAVLDRRGRDLSARHAERRFYGRAHRTSSPKATGRCWRSSRQVLPCILLKPFWVIALLAGRQRRADQPDHGLAAGLRDVQAAGRARVLSTACTVGRHTPITSQSSSPPRSRSLLASLGDPS